MSPSDPAAPQLPPTHSLTREPGLQATSEKWFEYLVQVYPHHTDYAGVVWHGTYLTWMEEARVEYLRSIGINYASLVSLGCDLPVVGLSLRYHLALRLGEEALIKTRLHEITGVRLNWDYKIQSTDEQQLYVTGKVTLVAIDRDKGKIMRQLPSDVKNILVKLVR